MKKWRLFENLIQFECWRVLNYNYGIDLNVQTFTICLVFIAEVSVKSQIIANPLEISYHLKEKEIFINL